MEKYMERSKAIELLKKYNKEEFMCIDEIQSKSKLGKVSMEILREVGIFEGMSESNQLSLFG